MHQGAVSPGVKDTEPNLDAVLNDDLEDVCAAEDPSEIENASIMSIAVPCMTLKIQHGKRVRFDDGITTHAAVPYTEVHTTHPKHIVATRRCTRNGISDTADAPAGKAER